MIVVNGWTLYAHPLLLDQLEKLITVVEKPKAKDPQGWARTANAKTLGAVRSLMFQSVPSDPTRSEYRQDGTLASAASTGFGQSSARGGSACFSATTAAQKLSSSPG